MTGTRSRADRYGQLTFTIIVCALLGLGCWWAVTLIPARWAQIIFGVLAALAWLLIAASGISAALSRRQR